MLAARNSPSVTRTSFEERKEFLDRLMRNAGSNEHSLQKLKNRIDRVSLKQATLGNSVQECYCRGSSLQGLPTILKSILKTIESIGEFLPSHKKKFSILHNVSGIIKPGW
ncbi:ABC transporter G family member 36-like [Punica granatum]|uniref:ABC transporter G family member 36-like n=1 Tax=Punica granatum TaxID=22663 RepID=A0A6P8CG69_PUNGR|nr:ABC transporter G family member 36-like [Punica granatum]